MTQTTFSISGMVIGPDGQAREATLFLADGRISQISANRDPGADLATDGLIIPGLIDLQVNGAYGADFTGDAASVSMVAARLPESGVTSFLPTVITSDFAAYPARLREIAGAMKEGQPSSKPGAHILGVHLEGPYMNVLRKGAHPPACIREIDVEEILAWAGPIHYPHCDPGP